MDTQGGEEEGDKCLWQRGWTHEGKGRREANACGGESGHIRGREEGATLVAEDT